MWRKISAPSLSLLDTALGELLIGALYFAMRSCEYTSTPREKVQKTKLLRLCDLRFFRKSPDGLHKDIPHSSPLSTLLSAECVSITFVNQKNGERMATITQHKVTTTTAKQPITRLCPVHAWGSLVHRIMAYPKSSPTSTVNTFLRHGKPVKITNQQIKLHLVSVVKSIGPDLLGVDIRRIGTHTVRTSAAMLMYLANIRTSTIMLLGRWKSDAFLLYLRRQVKEFTAGVTNQMTNQQDMFFSIPADHQQTSDLPNRHVAERDDPMTRDINSLASHSRFNGQPSKNNTSNNHQGHPPAFHTWG